jgi:hypothetical protein
LHAIVVGRLEAEPAVEPNGWEIVLLDLKIELLGPLVGSPGCRVLEHGGGDTATAVLGSGGHAEHPCPAPLDHQHADAEHVAVVGRGEVAALGTDPSKDELGGGRGVRASFDRRPGGKPLGVRVSATDTPGPRWWGRVR